MEPQMNADGRRWDGTFLTRKSRPVFQTVGPHLCLSAFICGSIIRISVSPCLCGGLCRSRLVLNAHPRAVDDGGGAGGDHTIARPQPGDNLDAVAFPDAQLDVPPPSLAVDDREDVVDARL
jgi:hypothetical protein